MMQKLWRQSSVAVFRSSKPVGWAEHDALAIASATFRVGKTG